MMRIRGKWRHRLAVLVAVIGLAGGGLAVGTGSAQAVVNAVGACLDANSTHYANNGDNIQLWGCNNHSEQLWRESWVVFNLTNSSGLCLDANSNDYPNDGDNVQLWDCNTHPEQQWTLTSAGQLQSVGTGMCLDANSNDYPNEGDAIQLWDCNTHPEQLWGITSAGQLRNSSGLCLDANSNDYANEGDNIQLWDCNTHPEQLWHESGTEFNFQNASGMCLDANSNDYPNDGDPVQLWDCNTHPEQLWTISSAGQLVNSSGLCLDANSNDYPNDGDNVQLWGCNTHLEQLWTRTGAGQLESNGTGPGPEGPWYGTNGPVYANLYYGYPYPNAPKCTATPYQCTLDKWGFYQGQCTSWVAYRLNELNGIAFTDEYLGRHWPDASGWGAVAKELGIAVNKTPALGAVAWYNYGHVAYVERVNSPTSVVISEMNIDYANGFQLRTITPSDGWPTDFLHIADR